MEVTYKEPVWEDGCEHPADGFLGTLWAMDDGQRVAWDLYIFPERGQLSLCFRWGNEPSEYISPGSLAECFARVAEYNEHPQHKEPHPYARALAVVQDGLARRLAASCEARWQATGDVLFGELAAFVGTFRTLTKR